MAAREFHGIILNRWNAPLNHNADDCDSGEWQDPWYPSKQPGAGLISPNESAEWRSESDGVMTGTSGWARWSVSAGGDHTEFVQVNWSIPFFGEPTITCAVFRSDPSDPFRDPRPPVLEIRPVVTDADGNPRWESQADRDQPALAQAASIAPYFLLIPASFFVGPPWFVTHPRVGFVVQERRDGHAQSALQFPTDGPRYDDMLMQTFRFRMEAATRAGFLAGFPNFYEAQHGNDTVGGTILIKHTGAEWRNVPLAHLKSVPVENFGERMRATNAYASQNGFVGGFPTFFHADYGEGPDPIRHQLVEGIVCGTVLLRSGAAEWRDVPLPELGNPALDDVEARFRGTQNYANRHGFVGGFPNLFHADHGHGIVCGTVLLKSDFAEWRDVLIFRRPR